MDNCIKLCVLDVRDLLKLIPVDDKILSVLVLTHILYNLPTPNETASDALLHKIHNDLHIQYTGMGFLSTPLTFADVVETLKLIEAKITDVITDTLQTSNWTIDVNIPYVLELIMYEIILVNVRKDYYVR